MFLKRIVSLEKKRTHNPTHCLVELASQTNREMNEKFLDHQLVLPWIPASACTLLGFGLLHFTLNIYPLFPWKNVCALQKSMFEFSLALVFFALMEMVSRFLRHAGWLWLLSCSLVQIKIAKNKPNSSLWSFCPGCVCVPWSSITWKMKSLAKCSARAYRKQIRLLGLSAWTKTLSGSSYSEELQAKPL